MWTGQAKSKGGKKSLKDAVNKKDVSGASPRPPRSACGSSYERAAS